MIEERTIGVAVCDACKRKDYANEYGDFPDCDGYTLTIVEHRTETTHEAYACRQTHIGKASRAVLDKFRAEGNGPPRDEAGAVALPPDAPPLPENRDTEAVTP